MHNAMRLVALLVFLPIGCGGNGVAGGVVPQVTQITITDQNDVELGSSILGAVDFFDVVSEVLFEVALIFEEGGTSGTFPCGVDGELTVSWTDVDPQGQLSPGDSATITFDGCVYDIGGELLTLDGNVTFTVGVPDVSQIAQTVPPAFRIEIVYVLDRFVLSFPGGDSMVLDGQFTYDYARELDEQPARTFVMVTRKVSGDYVEGTIHEGGGSYDVWLADFTFERLDNVSTGNYVIGFRGDMYDGSIQNDDGTFGGRFFFETGTVLAGVVPTYPTSGNWYCNGAHDTRTTYTAQPSGATVFIQTFLADGTRTDEFVAWTDLATWMP